MGKNQNNKNKNTSKKRPNILLILGVILLAIALCWYLFNRSDQTAEPSETQTTEQTQPPETQTEAPTTPPETEATEETGSGSQSIDEFGTYSSMEDVALYILTYNKLPSNYITKNEARALGWDGGSLEPYAPGKCIGGDRFGNYEGLLPEASGRTYTECDIDTLGASSRGAKRIVFSNDGLIYYTDDHYESFELIYGGENP